MLVPRISERRSEGAGEAAEASSSATAHHTANAPGRFTRGAEGFVRRLAEHGPGAPPCEDVESARRHCRELARGHYENFSVASWLVPATLRQDLCHLYAYCRWADDLADETGDPVRSQALLDWWQDQVQTLFRGAPPGHPVFVALRETVQRHQLPEAPFLDLLRAFRQDQTTTRYATFAELRRYCSGSADPVGRLVLRLAGMGTGPYAAEEHRLSDQICTGLQLANFCQDVAEDWGRGRIYLPQESLAAAGCDESRFERRECDASFRRLLSAEVARAEEHLRAGRALVGRAPRWLALCLELFVGGGLAILDAIRRQDYDVWTARPQVGRATKLSLLARAWWRSRIRPRSLAPRGDGQDHPSREGAP